MMKIIKFYTKNCTPCKVMKPIIDKLITNHPEIEYSEIDCSEETPTEWAQVIRSVPTLIFMKPDKPYVKAVGIKTYEYLESLINN